MDNERHDLLVNRAGDEYSAILERLKEIKYEMKLTKEEFAFLFRMLSDGLFLSRKMLEIQ